MSSYRNVLFICSFLLLLLVPFFIKVLHIPVDETNSEKRIITVPPVFKLDKAKTSKGAWNTFHGFNEDVTTYKEQFDSYHKNSFNLKNSFFDLYVFIKRSLLKGNPIPENVMEGYNGWFFLGNSYSNEMMEYTSLDNFTVKEVDSMKRNILDIAYWMKQKRIKFYIVITPDKQSIYGQYLPLIKGDKKTKLEQLKAVSNDHSYNLVDLVTALKEENKQYRLFHKTDTHWNDYGAFVGFRALITELQKGYPEIPQLDIGNFEIDTFVTYEKDLTEALRLKIKEDQIMLHYIIPEHGKEQKNILSIPQSEGVNPHRYEVRYANPQRKLKVLVFRDSFSEAWMKYFKECFGSCLFIRNYIIDKTLIEQENPDIVIYQKIERDIDVLLIPAS